MMAQQTINIGTFDNDPGAGTIRASYDICNDNFDEVYGTGSSTYQVWGTVASGGSPGDGDWITLNLSHIPDTTITSAKLVTSGVSSGTYVDCITTVDSKGLVTAKVSNGKVGTLLNAKLVVSIAASALTIALKTQAGTDPSASDPVYVGFRNASLTTTTVDLVAITSATSIVVPSTATLGTSNSDTANVYIYLVNTGSGVELAVTGGIPQDPQDLHSTTAISTGATNRRLIYSTTGLTTKAISLIGHVFAPQTTAGTWATLSGSTTALYETGANLPIGAWCRDNNIPIVGSTTSPTKPTTVQNEYMAYRRVGNSLELKFSYYTDNVSNDANDGSGDYYLMVPHGISIDTDVVDNLAVATFVAASIGSGSVGTFAVVEDTGSGTAFELGGKCVVVAANKLYFICDDSISLNYWGSSLYGIAAATTFDFGCSADLSFPCTGWS